MVDLLAHSFFSAADASFPPFSFYLLAASRPVWAGTQKLPRK